MPPNRPADHSLSKRPRKSLEDRVLEFWPQVCDSSYRMLICCSGGPDSMALLRVLLQLREKPETLSVVHFNHRLRGAAADEDEAFVRESCKSLRVPFHVGHATDQEIQENRDGVEAAARKARYRFVIDTAKKCGSRYVATGHNSDDQVETVLLNLFRGTGLAGLAGIPFVRTVGEAVSIVRPLLSCSRQAIHEYLTEIGQSFRQDATNQDRDFRRNRIRHDVLPLIEDSIHTNVRNAIQQTASIVNEAQTALRTVAQQLLDECLRQKTEHACVIKPHFSQLPPIHLRREMFVVLWQRQSWPLQSMTYRHWQQLAELLVDDAPPSRRVFPGGIHVEKQDSSSIRIECSETRAP